MKRSYKILLSVLGVVLFYSLVILPVSDKRALVLEEYQSKSESLEKYRSFIQSGPEIEEELKKVDDTYSAYSPLLIDADNEALGFSKFNSYIQTIISKSGVEVVSIKPLSERKYKLYAGMPIQINATATIDQLSNFLNGFASGPHMVRVNTLDVNVLNVNRPDKVRLSIEVVGYRTI